MNGELHDKNALVTGASRGIGRAIATALARRGVNVAVNYLTNERLAREVCQEIENCGARAVCLQADVSAGAAVGAMIAAVERDLGPLDILVNNAGIGRPQNMDTVTEQDWDETIAANLKSIFLVTQAALPGMRTRRWGRIINISSTAAHAGGLIGPHYTASKAGIIGLTHYYASRLAKEGITVNAIAPALIETDMVTDLKAKPDLIPVGRFGVAAEVADIAVALAANGYITGQTVSVNGGLYMT